MLVVEAEVCVDEYDDDCGGCDGDANQVMPLTCDRCRKNFCLHHRHEMDHECKGFENTGRAMSRQG